MEWFFFLKSSKIMLCQLMVFIWWFIAVIWLFCICWRYSRKRRVVHNCAKRRAKLELILESMNDKQQGKHFLDHFFSYLKFLSLQIYACDDFMSPNVILCRVDTFYFNAFIFLVISYLFIPCYPKVIGNSRSLESHA